MESTCDWERLVAAGLPAKNAQEAQQQYTLVTIRSSLDGGLVQVLRRIAHQRKSHERKQSYETTHERKRSRSVSIGPMRMELLSCEATMSKKRCPSDEVRKPEEESVTSTSESSISMRKASATLSSAWNFVSVASVYAQSACEEACELVRTFLQLPTKNQDAIELLFDQEDKLWGADSEMKQTKMRTRSTQKQLMSSWRTRRIT